MKNDSTIKALTLTAAYRAPTKDNLEHSFQFFNTETMKMKQYGVSGLWGDLVGLSDGDQVTISVRPPQADGTSNLEINPIQDQNVLS
jgi:hypothetical protein